MKILKLAAAAAMLSLSVNPVSATTVQITAQNPTIAINVSEQVNSRPDTATFSAQIDNKSKDAVEAFAENSRRMKVLIDRIKSLGISDKDIQTTGISVKPQYDYIREDPGQIFAGYRVSNSVQVKVRKIDRLGKILNDVVASGVTRLMGPSFSVEKDEEIKKLARDRALQNAKNRALVYARQEGYSGVRILSIRENLRSVSAQSIAGPTVMRAAAVESPPVELGQVGVTINLDITYEMTR